MKRLIAAGILLVLVFAVTVTGFVTTQKHYDRMKTLIYDCRTEYENGNKKSAAEKAAEIEKYWEEQENTLLMFLNRDCIDEIALSATRLAAYAEGGDDVLFCAELRLCRALLEHMHDGEQYT